MLRTIEAPAQLQPLGEAARQHVLASFSVAIYQRELTRVYLDLLDGRPSRA
jgi:hypothetical protein